jgi:hypothetical protein
MRGDYDVISGPSGETVPARPGDALDAGSTKKVFFGIKIQWFHESIFLNDYIYSW